MIWIRGKVVDDWSRRIGVYDRTFEHGLGLFETFRTWGGHPVLLGRHLARMQRSARELGLILDPDGLPDAAAVLLLKARCPAAWDDVRLRIILTGGVQRPLRDPEKSSLWMTASSLPPPPRAEGARILRTMLADPDDPLARHKTLNYWRRRIEQARAAEEGADEVLCVTPDGRVCEGTRSNLFLVRDGRLITPGTDGPLLPGVMRGLVIEQARRCGFDVVEGPVGLDEVARADEAFLTNSVRGILPLARLLSVELPAPGPITRRLWGVVLARLDSRETT